jgi:hypothetical protein
MQAPGGSGTGDVARPMPGLVGGCFLQENTHCWLFFHQTYAMNILQNISQDISELFRFDIDIEGRVFGVPI